MVIVSDVVEVKDGVYNTDPVLGCGLTNSSLTELEFRWYKDGKEIHTDTDSHRVIAVHKLPDYSTVNVSKLGNNEDLFACEL